MGWCVKCGYEYRPEIVRCPKCDAAVTDQPPAEKTNLEGIEAELPWLQKAKAALRRHLSLAFRALKLIFGSTRLLVIIGLLALIYISGNLIASRLYIDEEAIKAAAKIAETQNKKLPFFEQLLFSIQYNWLRPNYMLQGFATPLQISQYTFNPWFSVAQYPLFKDKTPEELSFSPQMDSYFWIIFFFESLLAIILSATIIITILHYLRTAVTEENRKLSLAIKQHFLPIITYYFGLALITYPFVLIPSLVNQYEIVSGKQPPFWIQNIVHIGIYDISFGYILPLLALLLTFVPFAIVGRGLGAWGGVKAGLVLLWQKRWVLISLLIIYRLVCGGFRLIKYYLLPVGDLVGVDMISTLLWSLFVLVNTIIGLWLAAAFMLLVVEPAPKVGEGAPEIIAAA